MQSRTLADVGGLRGEAAPDLVAARRSRISWGAILAGALLALTIATMLNMLGAAIGMVTVDMSGRDTPSASTLGLASGIWIVVAHLVALAVGGWVAGRLSGTVDRGDGGLHGLAVWAVAFLISAAILGNVLWSVASTASSGVASVVGSAAQGAGSAAAAATEQVDVEAQIERLTSRLRSGGDPSAMAAADRASEIGALIGQRITTGTLDDAQRERLAALVAAEAGISQQEAAQRLEQVEGEIRSRLTAAEEQARRAADAAASAAATTSFWLFAAMILGALAAMFGGRSGVRERPLPSRPAMTATA